MKPNPPLPLIEKLEIFQTILEGIDDAVFVKDSYGRYVVINSAAAKFLGKPVKDAIGKTDWDLFEREKAAQIVERDRLALKRGSALTFEDTVVVGGVARTFVTTMAPWHDHNGSPLGTFGRAREITDQRRMEKWLVDSEKRFRAMIEKSADFIALLDPEGIVLYASPSIAQVLGYAADQLSGRNIFSLVHPDDIDRTRRQFSNLTKDANATITDQFRYRTKGDAWKWIECTTTNFLEEPGVRAVVANYRDITDRKREEETRVLMASIIESSSDAIVSTNLDGTILTWNPAATRIYGYSQLEAAGQHISMIVPADRKEEVESLLRNVRIGEELRHHETEQIRKDGERIQVSLSASPIRNSEGRIIGASAICRDITVEKQRAEQQHRSQKMDAVMRIANEVSHDFNNALTIVLGYCDLMKGSHYPAANLPRDLERVRRTTERAADLARQLLAFGGKRTAVPVVLDLNIQIMKIEAMLPKLLHENIKLLLHLTRQPALIKADPQLVDQLIVNLAVNALEAMPEQGHLTIETANIDTHETKITRTGVIPPGSYVCLTVKDTGRGMTPEVISHLYEPFFSTKPRSGHMGLGLAMAYGVVTQSGGHIDAHSEPTRGTTFDIYLPRVDSHRSLLGPKRIRSTGSETILIAEDDPILREVAVEYLTSLGYYVLEAHDCAHAMTLCREHSSTVDLLLTDMLMPDMSGPALAEHIRDISPQTKVLFMSGYPNVDIPNVGSRGASLNFLSKPFNAAELGTKVRNILDADF